MNYTDNILRAVKYIEAHITDRLDYNSIAEEAYFSNYHFQRVFSLCCGCTLGEYIRRRRMTLAGAELASGGHKVIDVALKYGYESPDGFTKAFAGFHGVTPSEARRTGTKLRSFPKISEINLKGRKVMDYSVKNLDEITITGYSRRFEGSPDDRYGQQHDFMVAGNTRFVRYALQGMAKDCETEYCAVSDIDDTGFEFMIGTVIPGYFRAHLHKTAGEYEKLLKSLVIPPHLYISAETRKSVFSINEHIDLRRRLVCECLPESGFIISEAPEITVIHSFLGNKDGGYVEVMIPVEKN